MILWLYRLAGFPDYRIRTKATCKVALIQTPGSISGTLNPKPETLVYSLLPEAPK